MKTPVQKIVDYSKYTNTINKQSLDKLLEEEESLILNEVKDALDRGYALGFSDGITMTQGRPQSSNSENAKEYHIKQLKEKYFEP
jgi:hypothetical protein